MKNLILLIAIAFVFLHTSSFALDKSPIISFEKPNAKKIGLFISQDQLDKSPKWSPDKEDPILKISEAYKLVKKWSKTEFSKYDGVKISNIQLRTDYSDRNKDKWFYVFSISPTNDGGRIWVGQKWVAVLMNGNIIETKEY